MIPRGPRKPPLQEWDEVTNAFMAGLIEGDGWLSWNKPGQLQLGITLTDLDTVTEIASLWDTTVWPVKVSGNAQPEWRTTARSYQAQTIAERIYPVLGERRQATFRELLERWYEDRSFLGGLKLPDTVMQPSAEWTATSTAWLAGLFEAEGWIGASDHDPLCAQVTMTDRDVIDRAAAMLGVNVTLCDWYHMHKKTANGKPYKTAYTVSIRGASAAIALCRLCPYMHTRRRAKIEESITAWLTRPAQMKRWHGTVTAADILSGRVQIQKGATGVEPTQAKRD